MNNKQVLIKIINHFISSFYFQIDFRFNDSLSEEEKKKFYQAIGYHDDKSSQQLSYPQDVN